MHEGMHDFQACREHDFEVRHFFLKHINHALRFSNDESPVDGSSYFMLNPRYLKMMVFIVVLFILTILWVFFIYILMTENHRLCFRDINLWMISLESGRSNASFKFVMSLKRRPNRLQNLPSYQLSFWSALLLLEFCTYVGRTYCRY